MLNNENDEQFDNFMLKECWLELTKKIPFTPYLLDTSQDLNIQAYEMMKNLFPNWHLNNKIKSSVCTNGITNKLLKFQLNSNNSTLDNHNEVKLVRCYGQGTECLINRQTELLTHFTLSQLGYAPPLYYRFKNGFIYGYTHGQVCQPEQLGDLNKEGQWIARMLGEWHRVVHIKHNDDVPQVWNTLLKWLNNVPDVYKNPNYQKLFESHKEILSKSYLKHQIQYLKHYIPNYIFSPVVFCHNDLLAANIIYHNPENNNHDYHLSIKSHDDDLPVPSQYVTFIDYEYGSNNPRGFDIANHFNEFAGFDCDYSKYPTEDIQRQWCHFYLQHTNNKYIVEEYQITELLKEIDAYRPISHLYWGIWSLVQANISTIDFDYMQYAILRLQEFNNLIKSNSS